MGRGEAPDRADDRLGRNVRAGGTSVSTAVVETVAAHEGVDPATLTPPLYEVLDPDALDALFASQPGDPARATGAVTFTYREYTVTVSSDGRIALDT